MIADLVRALRLLGVASVRRVLALSALLAGLALAGWFALSWSLIFGTDLVGPEGWWIIPGSWIEAVADGLLVILSFGMILAIPAVFGVLLGFFLEKVADAAEARHFPTLPAGRDPTIAESLAAGLRFLLALAGLNLLALPFYLVPVLGQGVFLLLNGYLVAREYFELAGLRHAKRAEVRALWARGRPGLVLAGAGLALLLLVPLVNLFVPVLATGLMDLRFHRLRGLVPTP